MTLSEWLNYSFGAVCVKIMNVLVTGASGFLGRQVCAALEFAPDKHLRACIRKGRVEDLSTYFEIPTIDSETVWDEALRAQDVVVHTAARTNVIKDEGAGSLAEYKKVNVDGTLNLARQAALNGVKRFIFISSIKVNGEHSLVGRPFAARDKPLPKSNYAISKYESELGLLKLAAETEMEVVIIRSPLIYGPGVKGNFSYLVNLVKRRVPLPFGLIKNKRSMIALDNLVDFILLIVDRARSPRAANQVFLLSDEEDVSTPSMIQLVAAAYGVHARLLPAPVFLMQLAGRLLGKPYLSASLFGDLQVDSSEARELLGWKPVVTMNEQLKKMAEFDMHTKNT